VKGLSALGSGASCRMQRAEHDRAACSQHRSCFAGRELVNPSGMHDEAEIVVRSGKGGAGCVSFRREKYIPEGGPDGGDGGSGGDVVCLGDSSLNTLGAYVRKRHWKARNGQPGSGRHKSGKAGDELLLRVPLGTIVRDAESGEVPADGTGRGQRVVLAAGGRGGRGNARFKSATNQVPRQSQPGEPAVELRLRLELKLLADVGLIGLPNAGKSTLLGRLSEARPKIGDYPFTTLEPNLGVIERYDRQVLVADIPGLIEGAAEGAGLGHRFLRHVERCRLLLHLLDGSEGDVDALAAQVAVLQGELERFSAPLADKDQLLVLNKADARPELPALAAELSERLRREVLTISAVSGQGMDEMLSRVLELVPPRENIEP